MEILEIKNVSYSYANSKEKVLSGVNQKFELGKFYAIVGKSGAGKSTLLSLLAGLDKPQTGQILFKNEDIQKKAAEAKKKKIKKILTPEQYAKWQTEQATARQKAPQMRMHKGNHTNKI